MAAAGPCAQPVAFLWPLAGKATQHPQPSCLFWAILDSQVGPCSHVKSRSPGAWESYQPCQVQGSMGQGRGERGRAHQPHTVPLSVFLRVRADRDFPWARAPSWLPLDSGRCPHHNPVAPSFSLEERRGQDPFYPRPWRSRMVYPIIAPPPSPSAFLPWETWHSGECGSLNRCWVIHCYVHAPRGSRWTSVRSHGISNLVPTASSQ